MIYNDNGRLHRQRAGHVHAQDSDLGINYGKYATACKFGAPAAAGVCPGLDPVTGKNTNKGTAFAVPPGSPGANNNSLRTTSIRSPIRANRASALYQINDDWNALVTQTYQDMSSQGVFYQMPNSSDGVPLQPLQVTTFKSLVRQGSL